MLKADSRAGTSPCVQWLSSRSVQIFRLSQDKTCKIPQEGRNRGKEVWMPGNKILA